MQDVTTEVTTTASKVLLILGISLAAHEFTAGVVVASLGQVAVSLQDPPATKWELIKRVVGTLIVAYIAALCCGEIDMLKPWYMLIMGVSGAFSMVLIKVLGLVKKKAESRAEPVADKIIGIAEDKFDKIKP